MMNRLVPAALLWAGLAQAGNMTASLTGLSLTHSGGITLDASGQPGSRFEDWSGPFLSGGPCWQSFCDSEVAPLQMRGTLAPEASLELSGTLSISGYLVGDNASFEFAFYRYRAAAASGSGAHFQVWDTLASGDTLTGNGDGSKRQYDMLDCFAIEARNDTAEPINFWLYMDGSFALDSAVAIPEPSTYGLMLAGLAVVLGRRRAH